MAGVEWRDDQGRKVSDPRNKLENLIQDRADNRLKAEENRAHAVISRVNKTHKGKPVDSIVSLLGSELARNVNGFDKSKNAGFIREWAQKISDGTIH
jgi:hypothetical protein